MNVQLNLIHSRFSILLLLFLSHLILCGMIIELLWPEATSANIENKKESSIQNEQCQFACIFNARSLTFFSFYRYWKKSLNVIMFCTQRIKVWIHEMLLNMIYIFCTHLNEYLITSKIDVLLSIFLILRYGMGLSE